VLFCTLLAAVGHSGAAPTVSQFTFRGGRGVALPANNGSCTTLFGGGRRGLGRLTRHFVEGSAKVVAHRVHAGGVVSLFCVERDDILYL
jgi:hypothetical protein